MAKWKRPTMPKELMTLRKACREVGIPYEKGLALFEFMVDSVIEGRLVSIPRFGRFWVGVRNPRRIVMPVEKGSTELKEIKSKPSLKLIFRVAVTMNQRLRRQARGRAKGTH